MDNNLSKVYTLLIGLLILSILLLSFTIFFVGKNLGELSECVMKREMAQEWWLSIRVDGPRDREQKSALQIFVKETVCKYGEIEYGPQDF